MKGELEDEETGKRTNGARGRRPVLTNLQGVQCIPWRSIQTTHEQTHAHRHTWQHVINIVSCSGGYHGGVHQLLSLEQHMCGRFSRRKATRLTTLLIKTCRPSFVCVCACVPVCFLCAQACFPHFPLVCTSGECACLGARGTSESGQGCYL